AEHIRTFIVSGNSPDVFLEHRHRWSIIADFRKRFGQRQSGWVVCWIEPQAGLKFRAGFLESHVSGVQSGEIEMRLRRFRKGRDQFPKFLEGSVRVTAAF